MIEMRRRCVGEKEPYIPIPAEYQQVEYLESTGTQYIKLFITPKESSKLTIRYNVSEDDIYYVGPMGIFNTTRKDYFLIGRNASGGRVTMPGDIVAPAPIGSIVDVEINNLKVFVNNELKAEFNYVFPIDFIGIFAYFEADDNGMINKINKCKARIYKFTYNNKLELIPCYRKADNVPGMYDRVNDVFYTNAGTGSFIVGPDVN